MIVKNEEKYLEQCLTAVKPIFDNVDSELIIADTGSTDRTVEIAKKFTDNVYYFEWIKDFAAARNSTIERARGEWYLYIDADEIFASCDDIIRFFNSGEYRNYTSASYLMRNHVMGMMKDKVLFTNFYPVRLVKLTPDTRFVGSVHERINELGEKRKTLNDSVDHYGYLYENDEAKQKKFERNSELLLDKLKESGGNPSIFLQLSDTYSMSGDDEASIQYLKEGIEWCKKHSSDFVLTLYMKSAFYYYRKEQYELSVGECEAYFKKKAGLKLGKIATDAEIYGIETTVLTALKRYDEAIKCGVKYFGLFKELKSGKLHTPDMYHTSYVMASDSGFINTIVVFSLACVRGERYNTAEEYLTSLPIEKYDISGKTLDLLIDSEISVLEHLEYKNANRYYQRLNDNGKALLINKLIEKLYADEKKNVILDAMASIGKDVERLGKKVEIYRNYFIENKADEFQLEKYVILYGIMNNIDLIAVAMNTQIDISFMFSARDIDIQKCAYLCCKNFVGFYDVAENYRAESVVSDEHLSDALKFYECCISVKLIENEDKTTEEKEQLVARLFGIKTAIKKRFDRGEFDKMAVTIKQNIRNSISSENYKQAKKTLSDYKQINPNDAEIGELEIMLQGK